MASRFKPIREIGRGSSGVVTLVSDRQTNAQYVMKSIGLAGSDEVTLNRILGEVKAMSHIDHPNVVRFKTSFVTRESVSIVMEKCEGTLEDVISRARETGRTIAEGVLVEWMTELLCALQHLHNHNIIHRDIKPSNVFLSKRNHVKIGDFGVCKVAQSCDNFTARSIIGTPEYIAPEVLDGQSYDQRSDVWSLGVLFYELCALRSPFAAGNILAIARLVGTGEYVPLPVSFDRRFARIVDSMLQVDPSRRVSISTLLEQYLVLPKSHPSHPSHNPHDGRAIQRDFGPAAIYEPQSPKKPLTKFSKRSGVGETETAQSLASTRDLSSEERTGSPLPAQPMAGKRARPPSSSNTSGPSETSQPLLSRKTSVKLVHTSGREMTSEEHVASLNRIRNARSRIDVASLRREMRAKSVETASEAQVFVPSSVSPSHRDPVTAHSEHGVAYAVRRLLEEHSATLTLHDLDEVVEAIHTFKIHRFGLC
jgi:serine/threonine protein kinase